MLTTLFKCDGLDIFVCMSQLMIIIILCLFGHVIIFSGIFKFFGTIQKKNGAIFKFKFFGAILNFKIF